MSAGFCDRMMAARVIDVVGREVALCVVGEAGNDVGEGFSHVDGFGIPAQA